MKTQSSLFKKLNRQSLITLLPIANNQSEPSFRTLLMQMPIDRDGLSFDT